MIYFVIYEKLKEKLKAYQSQQAASNRSEFLDKLIKFVSVGLPLMLVSMAFAREISLGEQQTPFFACFDECDDILYIAPIALSWLENLLVAVS